MNSGQGRPVQPVMQRAVGHTTLWRIVAPLVCLAVHGCTEAPGGAVELSWALRSTQDEGIDDCAGDRVSEIQLWWQTDQGSDFHGFPCRASHGTTTFELPPGPVALQVVPSCAFETGPRCLTSPTPCECISHLADSATFESPPPIQREAVAGGVITLDAVVLIVDATEVCRLDLLCP